MKKLSIILGIILSILTIIYYTHWLITPKDIKIINSNCNISNLEINKKNIDKKNAVLNITGKLISNCDINIIELLKDLNLQLVAFSTSENNSFYLSPGSFIIDNKGNFIKNGIGLGAASDTNLKGTLFNIYILLIDKNIKLQNTMSKLPEYDNIVSTQVKRL